MLWVYWWVWLGWWLWLISLWRYDFGLGWVLVLIALWFCGFGVCGWFAVVLGLRLADCSVGV